MSRSKRRRTQPFLMVHLDVLRHPSFCALTPAQRILDLELLATAGAQNYNGPPRPPMRVKESYSLLQKHTGLNSSTIARGLRALEAKGFLKKVGEFGGKLTLRPGGDIDTTGEYEISDDWKKTESR